MRAGFYWPQSNFHSSFPGQLYMRKTELYSVVFGILFLFIIQMAGTLVESIYILDLMHTSLDEKALGVLFFFSPLLLLFFRRKAQNKWVWWVWIVFGLLFFARGVTPYLNTSARLLASGIGTGGGLILLALLLTAKPKGDPRSQAGWGLSAGLGLAVCLSVLLRTLNFSLDASLTSAGGWIGWGLGLLLAGLLTRLEWHLDWRLLPSPRKEKNSLAAAVVGIFLILTLVYFAFSAPAVIARWTGGSYPLIVIAVSLLSAAWAWAAVCQPRAAEKLSRGLLVGWNLAFTLSLVGTILAQRVAFPQAPGGVAEVGGTITAGQMVPLVLMLLLFPVLFVNLRLFTNHIRRQSPSPAALVPGLMLGSGVLLLLVFINIFTNVWGYIPPLSTPFRNLFWLPFLLSAGGLTLLIGIQKTDAEETSAIPARLSWGWTVLLVVIFLASAGASLRAAPLRAAAAQPTSLIVMTYNIQAGNDGAAEHAYERQLALIRQVSPDILALQESDTARISLNNNDYVLYYAASLGYYSYYGPTTVAGTFGTAILSKYPLLNPGVLFSYSDTDEIGTAAAEIEVGGRRFTIYNVHPDGSDAAKLAWAQTLLARAHGKTDVIALGDYNTRKDDPAYKLFSAVYTNAWTSAYPSEISPDGMDMSGRNRIDHIFVSPTLGVRDPKYLLPPDSATDHPVHWAEIFWEK
jgi:endonuclease/exonuclease/phosphatase family metal-dependent hydrolase